MAGKITVGVLLLLAILLAGLFTWFRTSLPQVSGTMRLPGISGEIVIARDRYGVPHVTAGSDDDAMFAIGFVQAQDRIFQMDMLRRFGEGRLSEIAGHQTVSRDAFMRTLGIEQAAARQLAQLAPPVRHSLEHFADGVNAWLRFHPGARFPLYYVLPAPAAWRPLDTLVVEKLMTLYLTRNMHEEILHAELAKKLTPAELRDLFPDFPPDGLATIAQTKAALNRLSLEPLRLLVPPEFGTLNASNNWVLDGRHTVTGKPILENDPHLTYTSPAIWYLADVKAPGLWLAGGMIPGIPFVLIGHNQHVGWGMTETGGDVEDLFIEKLDPADGNRYLAPNGSVRFETRHETIHVKGGKDVVLTVRSTRHGPIISDLSNFDDSTTPRGLGEKNPAVSVGEGAKRVLPGPQYVLALAATYLKDNDHTPEALWGINRAQNWSEFHDALRDFGAPQMNIVYGDVSGTIAFIAPGLIPIRRNGYGWIPHAGWTGEFDWTGFIPFDALPQSVNPPAGRFVTANNKIIGDSYPYFVSLGWADPYRADRISELLDSGAKQSLDSTAKIAGDVESKMAQQLLPVMLRLTKPGTKSAAAFGLLQNWDYAMRADLPAPLIFAAWTRALNEELFRKRLGDLFPSYWGFDPKPVFNILTKPTSWCNAGAGETSCAAKLSRSLDDAVEFLSKNYGADAAKWRWGVAHQAEFRNPALSEIPLIGSIFNNDIPADGGEDTVNAGYMNIGDTKSPFAGHGGPGLRMILDLSDLTRSRFLMSPGVSGNPFSGHYGDLLVPWRNFDWMVLSRAETVSSFTLLPRR